MDTKTVTVPGISCDGCVRAIENEVGEMNGVTDVRADVDSKQVVVQWDEPASWQQIEALLVEMQYPPEQV